MALFARKRGWASPEPPLLEDAIFEQAPGDGPVCPNIAAALQDSSRLRAQQQAAATPSQVAQQQQQQQARSRSAMSAAQRAWTARKQGGRLTTSPQESLGKAMRARSACDSPGWRLQTAPKSTPSTGSTALPRATPGTPVRATRSHTPSRSRGGGRVTPRTSQNTPVGASSADGSAVGGTRRQGPLRRPAEAVSRGASAETGRPRPKAAAASAPAKAAPRVRASTSLGFSTSRPARADDHACGGSDDEAEDGLCASRPAAADKGPGGQQARSTSRAGRHATSAIDEQGPAPRRPHSVSEKRSPWRRGSDEVQRPGLARPRAERLDRLVDAKDSWRGGAGVEGAERPSGEDTTPRDGTESTLTDAASFGVLSEADVDVPLDQADSAIGLAGASPSQDGRGEPWESAERVAPSSQVDSFGEGEAGGSTDVEALHRQLDEAREFLEAVQARRARLHDALADMRGASEGATQGLRGLAGRPLAEIKRLLRSPPEPVRRTLAATWLFLNCSRYREQKAVRFDEVKDWQRCQRMISMHGFVSRVLDFEPEELVAVPHVMTYLRNRFFKQQNGDGGDAAPSPRRRPASVAAVTLVDRSAALAMPQPVRASSTIGHRSPTSLLTYGDLVAAQSAPPPLDLPSVERASLPCGALVKWMLALLQEQELRPGLLVELHAVDLDLARAQQRFAALEAQLRIALAPKPKPAPPAPVVVKPTPVSVVPAPVMAPKKEAPKPKPKPKPKPEPVAEPEPVPEPAPVKRELDIREKLRLFVHAGGANPLARPAALPEVAKPAAVKAQGQYQRPAGLWGLNRNF
eukprot:TRINITY_DN11112_c1_g1_i2.p1 TRINITY_DN11112_c1_g1~~TRINITY_DN11112_c1_g1_i2.p1  ORF type:complete len:806 (-),score=197.38 TRINITY_DN11112_c1_g1_i2:53-2470(-)